MSTPIRPIPNRRKLWEHEDYQCPILGTCLSMAELRKLARKLGVVVKPNATDYELHAFFVRECRQESPIAIHVNKYLDKKYRKDLRLFAKIGEEQALEALWRNCLKGGDVPGPFWALMSHPAVGDAALNRAFGEIHMLSHLMGSANRADLKRLGRQERRLDDLAQALSRVQQARRAQKLEWALRVRDLEVKLEAESLERLKLARRVREAALPRQDTDLEALRTQLDAAREETRRQAAIIEGLYRENAGLRERLGETSRDLDRAELELARLMPCAEGGGCGPGGHSCEGETADGLPACAAQAMPPLPALSGKKVLYVGGRSSLVPHYRHVVERQGCVFHHHDGGLENSPGELHGKLAAADMVLCPVDCVSHEACTTVKKACKHGMKPLHLLRSSGLSALVRSLDSIAGIAAPGTADQTLGDS